MIRINRHRNGPRLYVFGFRAHHGPIAGGAAIFAWRCGWKHLAVALGAYAATDWRDAPFRDCDGGHDTIMGWALRQRNARKAANTPKLGANVIPSGLRRESAAAPNDNANGIPAEIKRGGKQIQSGPKN